MLQNVFRNSVSVLDLDFIVIVTHPDVELSRKIRRFINPVNNEIRGIPLIGTPLSESVKSIDNLNNPDSVSVSGFYLCWSAG